MATVPYADVTFATTYFGEQLKSEDFDDADPADQLVALQQATKMIDLIPFVNAKAEEAQVREFPRTDETEIPLEVQEACCEVAIMLLGGFDPKSIAADAGKVSESVGDAAVAYGTARSALGATEETFGLPSAQAIMLLNPWIASQDEIDLVRV